MASGTGTTMRALVMFAGVLALAALWPATASRAQEAATFDASVRPAFREPVTLASFTWGSSA
jgi:hypothetical protein